MSAILEIPEVRQRVSRLSVEEYHRLAELVIEVAVSSPTLDRENASLYAEARVTEYWIVLAAERRVEVYHRPENGRYQEMRLLGPDDPLQSASVPTLQMSVAGLFA